MNSDLENWNTTMENPSSPFKILEMPDTSQPLQPISSERRNQQRIPQSPSLPLMFDGNGSPKKSHQPRLSDAADVRARIAYINAVSQPNSPVRSNSPTKPPLPNISNAAIQRAILGREEAEGALTTLTTQLESAQARERLVSERVESLMEQLTETRNRQRHERTVYEKEIRQTKKVEYKAELAVIKLQEDLREVRGELENYKARSEHDKAEKEKARQEAFERAYVVAGMTEEIQEVRRRLEVAEQERDAAVAMAAIEMPMQEEKPSQNPTHSANDGSEKINQPTTNAQYMFFDEMDLEAPDCPADLKLAALRTEIDFLRRQVKEGQETIHFMNMQCQFKACPCRMAEQDGVRFVHDYEYDARVRARNAKRRKVNDVEPELPLPVFKSWIRKQEEAKGKQSIQQETPIDVQSDLTSCVENHDIEQESGTPTTRISQDTPMNDLVAPLPPIDVEHHEDEHVEEIATLEEAANIPLPSLKPMELEPSDDTPEPTAQLEEITQVIVEPVNSSKDFLFSTSTTSNKAVHEPMSVLRRSHDVRMSDDLFDISPPKRRMPPRPSTAMGVLTVESPIRLVPQSPQVLTQQAITPDVDSRKPMTTRIALNDTSPVRQSRQPRQQPKPSNRDRSRGKSPAPKRSVEDDRSSPAPATLFPITTANRKERVNRHQTHLEPRPQTVQGYYPEISKEFSTTTTVPIRDDSEQVTALLPSDQTAPASVSTPFSVPGTPNMTREAALAQIRARRDRARSVNMRKPGEEGSKTPGSVARRGVNLNLKEKLGDVKGRDFSQASAPGRIN